MTNSLCRRSPGLSGSIVFLSLLLAGFLPRPAAADTDTVAVSQPTPVVETGPAPTLYSGSAGTWWPIPIPSGTASAWAPSAGLSAMIPLTPLTVLGARQSHSIVFDSARQRFIAFGGTTQPDGTIYNDLWERALGASGDWTPMSANGTPPAPRYLHSAIYDPVGDRVIVFGGQGPGLLGDLWELTLSGTPTWSPLATSGTPPSARAGHTANYDAAHHRMIVFGGEAPLISNEVWYLDLDTSPPTWQIGTASGPPPPREYHSAIVDAAHDQLVIYGGIGTTYLADVWTLSLGATPTWTPRYPTGTAPGQWASGAAGYDAPGNRMVVVPGHYFLTYTSTIWGLDLTSYVWEVIPAADTPPGGRAFMGFAMDPVTRTGVLSGGVVGYDATLNDTWGLTTDTQAQWTLFAGTPTPPSPPPPPPPAPPPASVFPGADRYAAAGVFDASRGRFIVLGGAVFPVANRASPLPLNDIHTLSIGADSTWIHNTDIPAESLFTPRFGHSAILDPLRDRILLFGGYDGANFLNDLYEIRLSPKLSCRPLATLGSKPPVRDFHTVIYDPIRDRMIIFGGNNFSGFRNDTWALNLSGTPTWVDLAPSGSLPSRRLTSRAVYDSYSDRMLIFGGYGPGTTNDLWALSLSSSPAWTHLAPSGGPPPERHSHSFVLDPNRQRALVFGGVRQETGTVYGDLWELSLAGALQWKLLLPSGQLPSRRYGHLALVDPGEDRMLLSGGYLDAHTLSDLWRLQWGNGVPTATTTGLISTEVHPDRVELRWDVVASAGTFASVERRNPDGAWNAVQQFTLDGSRLLDFVDRDVVPGARYGYRVTLDEGGIRTTSSETWVEIPGTDGLTLQGFSPNPGTSRARVSFSLPDSRPATVDLIDVSGRRVAQRVLDHPAVGATSVELAPEGALGPGLYFIRLTQGGRTIVRRGTLMR